MSITIKPEIGPPTDQNIRVECTKCSGKTSHLTLTAVDVRGSEGDKNYSFDWSDEHQIVSNPKAKSWRS